jgi:uncharacterized membrane protein YfcA
MTVPLLLPLLIFIAALLYASVGHGGASAYLAIMALLEIAPDQARPIALALNLVVSALALWRFARVGAFDLRLFASVAVGAVPLAFVGGLVHVPPAVYRPLLGIVLLASAGVLLVQGRALAEDAVTPPPARVAVPVGATLGLLAGLTGTGGGIFLSPVMLFARWAEARTVAGVAAAFIFVNSAAGLAGSALRLGNLPPAMPWLVLAAASGGLLGSSLSAGRWPRAVLVRLLGVVLIVASAKLVFGG